jgi:hypothetical protein
MRIGIHAIGFLFWFLKINQVSESGTPRWLGGGLVVGIYAACSTWAGLSIMGGGGGYPPG